MNEPCRSKRTSRSSIWSGLWWAVVLFTLIGAFDSLAEPAEGSERDELSTVVAGRVVDQLDRPLASVRLYLRNTGRIRRPLATTTTDGEGRYAFPSVSPGEYELAADLETKLAETGRTATLGRREIPFSVAAGQREHRIDFVLQVGGVLAGRVLDRDGNLLAGARLSAPGLRHGNTSARTDRDGVFQFFFPIPLGRQPVTAWHPEHGSVHQWVDVPFGVEHVDLRLPAPLLVCIEVADDEGNPIEGVEMVASASGHFSDLSSARSDSRGWLELKVPAAGLYEIRRVGSTRSAPRFTVPVDRGRCLQIRVERTATIAGRVVWSDGLDPEPLRVYLPGTDEQEVDPATGRFEISGALPGFGTVVLWTRAGEFRTAVPVKVPRGSEIVPVEVVIEKGHTLMIRTFRGTRPAGGERVSVRGEIPWASWSPESDEEGWVRLEGLAAGTYRVELRGGDETTVTVPRPDPLVLGGPESGISIEVVDERGTPVEGGHVEVSRSGGGCSDLLSLRRTDVDNIYWAPAPPGSYRVRVWRSDRVPARRSVEVLPSRVTEVRIEVQEGPAIQLQVEGPEGIVPSTVQVAFRTASGWQTADLFARPLPDGTLILRSLPIGDHEVRLGAASSGYGSAIARVVVPGPPVRFALPLLSTLEVSIPALAQAPAPARLLAFDAAGRAHSFSCCDDGTPLEIQGTTKPILTLAPHRWRIVVEAADGRSWEGETSTRSGELTRLSLSGDGR